MSLVSCEHGIFGGCKLCMNTKEKQKGCPHRKDDLICCKCWLKQNSVPKPMKSVDAKIRKIITREDDCKDELETCRFHEKTTDMLKALFLKEMLEVLDMAEKEVWNGATRDEVRRRFKELRLRVKQKVGDV